MVTYLDRGAVLSADGVYRYSLRRRWAEGGSVAAFVMLNPSTADAQQDDPTVRRCVAFARAWGHAALEVVNLFAYRATDPKALPMALDPVGPDNDRHLREVARGAAVVVAAWGLGGMLLYRAEVAVRLLTEHASLHALRITKGGHPAHPLYLPGHLRPALWHLGSAREGQR